MSRRRPGGLRGPLHLPTEIELVVAQRGERTPVARNKECIADIDRGVSVRVRPHDPVVVRPDRDARGRVVWPEGDWPSREVVDDEGNLEPGVAVRPSGNVFDRERCVSVDQGGADRKSTRLNSSHANISYAVFCLKKKTGI